MRSQHSQLLSVLLLLMMSVGAMVFVIPKRAEVKELQTKVEERASALASTELDYVSLQSLAEEVGSSASAKEKLLDAVPVGTAQDELILELSEIARKAGFQLNALNFSEGEDQEMGSYLGVSANFSGDYDKLIAFLQRIENADRLMRVTNLSIQLTSTDSIVFNVNIAAFHQ